MRDRTRIQTRARTHNTHNTHTHVYTHTTHVERIVVEHDVGRIADCRKYSTPGTAVWRLNSIIGRHVNFIASRVTHPTFCRVVLYSRAIRLPRVCPRIYAPLASWRACFFSASLHLTFFLATFLLDHRKLWTRILFNPGRGGETEENCFLKRDMIRIYFFLFKELYFRKGIIIVIYF